MTTSKESIFLTAIKPEIGYKIQSRKFLVGVLSLLPKLNEVEFFPIDFSVLVVGEKCQNVVHFTADVAHKI